jgi:hypothetical protein
MPPVRGGKSLVTIRVLGILSGASEHSSSDYQKIS